MEKETREITVQDLEGFLERLDQLEGNPEPRWYWRLWRRVFRKRVRKV